MQAFNSNKANRFTKWLPTPGNMIFTLMLIAVFVWAQSTGAFPAPTAKLPSATAQTSTIAYQGRLADSNGNPLTEVYPMVFRLYNSPAMEAQPLWEENWAGANSVTVSNGVFNVMLGTLTPISQSLITENSALWLGVSIGDDDEMLPRAQLGSVPFAMQANTVLNGSITTEKIADGAITQEKAPTLLQSANGANEIIRSGNTVFPGSDENGFIEVTYPCFPNGVRTFMAVNGHWDANHSQVIAHNGAGRCSTKIKLSAATSNAIRINWLAIGN